MNIWPFKKQPAIEEKSLSAPDDVIREIFGSVMGSSSITTEQALSVPAVNSAIRLISEAAGSLPVKVIAISEDGSEAEDKSHPVAKLLNGEVNDWTSSFEFIRDLTAQALTHDAGGLAYVNRVENRVMEVIHYETGNLNVAYSQTGTKEPSYTLSNTSVSPENVIHMRGAFSKAPITLAKDAIAVSKKMEQHAANLFANGARPGGVIEFPNKIGEDAYKKMAAAWRAAHEGEQNAGKTAILWDGAKFNPMALNSTDAQFQELRIFQNIEIARAFRVPPSMIFELDRATWSNTEQLAKEFLCFGLDPWLMALESAFNRSLFSRAERNSWKVVFQRTDLTQADLTSRSTAYSSLIASRILNPNEARAKEGLAPYDGGEAFVNPNISQVGGE